MSYIDFIKEEFSDYKVVEEVDMDFQITSPTIIYKQMGGGQSYNVDSLFQPIQLILKTTDVSQGLSDLSTFAQAQTNTYVIQDLTYYRQWFATPFNPNNNQQHSNNFVQSIYLSGTLVISTNINDITKVVIDGEEYETADRNLFYKAVADTQPVSQMDRLGKTNITSASTTFTMSMENKENVLCTSAKRIRQGDLSADTEFTIVLTFSQNETTETYTMKMLSATLNTSNTGSPVISFEFGR